MQVSVSNSKIRRLNFWPNIARLYIEISMPFRSIALEWISLNFLSRPFRPFIRCAEREGKKENQLDDNRIFDSARFYFSKSILSSGRNIYFPLWQRRNGTYPLLPSFFFSFSFFGGFRYLFSRLASISPIVSHGSIKYSSIRPTSLLETCNNFVFTFPSNRRVN